MIGIKGDFIARRRFWLAGVFLLLFKVLNGSSINASTSSYLRRKIVEDTRNLEGVGAAVHIHSIAASPTPASNPTFSARHYHPEEVKNPYPPPPLETQVPQTNPPISDPTTSAPTAGLSIITTVAPTDSNMTESPSNTTVPSTDFPTTEFPNAAPTAVSSTEVPSSDSSTTAPETTEPTTVAVTTAPSDDVSSTDGPSEDGCCSGFGIDGGQICGSNQRCNSNQDRCEILAICSGTWLPSVDEPLNPPSVDDPLNPPLVDDPSEDLPSVDDPLSPPSVDDPSEDLPSVDDPLSPPSVDDPSEDLPSVDDPLNPPSVDDPSEDLPSVDDPLSPPSVDDPSEDLPSVDDPLNPPSVDDPSEDLPSVDDPLNPPSVDDPSEDLPSVDDPLNPPSVDDPSENLPSVDDVDGCCGRFGGDTEACSLNPICNTNQERCETFTQCSGTWLLNIDDDEPLFDEPIVDEPIVDEPIVDEPIVDETPIVDEPLLDETPIVDETLTTVLSFQDVPGVCNGPVNGVGCASVDPNTDMTGGNPNDIVNCFSIDQVDVSIPFQLETVRFWIGESAVAPTDLKINVFAGTAADGPMDGVMLYTEEIFGYTFGENTADLGMDLMIFQEEFCVGISSTDANSGLRVQTDIMGEMNEASYLKSPACGIEQFQSLTNAGLMNDFCIEALVSNI